MTKAWVAALLGAMTVLGDLARAADGVRAHVLLPSRNTARELDVLSQKPNVMVDLLTIDRKEYLLQLEAVDGSTLSGHTLTPDSHLAMSVELGQVALLYYAEIPADLREKPTGLISGRYPSLPDVGSPERGLDCSALDLELARAGTIRWYARYHGATAFTDSQARAQHGKNALRDVGIGAIIVVDVFGMAAGGGALPLPSGGSKPSNLRWAVTAADRREIGLLRLKRDRRCPAQAVPNGETSDLELLTRIESSRQALDSHQMSDQEQMARQTELLDQLDPPMPPPAREASAAEAAAGFERVAEPVGEGAVSSYTNVAWFASGNALSPVQVYQGYLKQAPYGTLEVTDRSLTLLSETNDGLRTGFGVNIPFQEIDSIDVTTFGLNAVVVVKQRSGHLDSFQVRRAMSRRQTTQIAEFLRAKLRAQTSGSVRP